MLHLNFRSSGFIVIGLIAYCAGLEGPYLGGAIGGALGTVVCAGLKVASAVFAGGGLPTGW